MKRGKVVTLIQKTLPTFIKLIAQISQLNTNEKTTSLSTFLGLTFFSQTIFAQQDSFLKGHLERWANSRKY